MKKTFVILIVGLAAVIAQAAASYAHEEGKHHSTVKGAIRELHEAKEILGKLSPDAGGHIASASQAVDQALQELAAVKEERHAKKAQAAAQAKS